MFYLFAASLTLHALVVRAFTINEVRHQQISLSKAPPPTTTRTTTAMYSSLPDIPDEADDAAIQWELLQKYHSKGSWKGVWSSYDYMGDMIDETVASVDLMNAQESGEVIQHTHTVVVGAKRSDCATCFDSMETKVLPVAKYTPDTFKTARPIRLASRSWVNGPTVLKSGAVATELILAYGDARVRAVFQHAPVWPKEVDTSGEAGLPPPQGLKLFRVTVSREALRDQPPTAETEKAHFASMQDEIDEREKVSFYRPVPPFNWHKVWSGTSWTWGPSSGNRGWSVEAIEDGDDWHGSSPVESWNLRIPGGLFLQSPRMITPDATGLLRMAWLPNDEVLVRAEAGVLALQPMDLTDDEDLEESTVFAFEPPSLASLRCDVLCKTGDLQGEPQFVKDQRETQATSIAGVDELAKTAPTGTTAQDGSSSQPTRQNGEGATSQKDKPKDDAQTIGDILQL